MDETNNEEQIILESIKLLCILTSYENASEKNKIDNFDDVLRYKTDAVKTNAENQNRYEHSLPTIGEKNRTNDFKTLHNELNTTKRNSQNQNEHSLNNENSLFISGNQNKFKNFDEALQYKLCTAKDSPHYSNVMNFLNDDHLLLLTAKSKNDWRWCFILTCLRLIETIHHIIENTNNEKTKLFSFKQKKIFQTTFEFVVPVGLSQYLLPGVGVSPNVRSKKFHEISTENLTDFGKYKRLCHVTDIILKVLSSEVFQEIILAKYLEDLIASLVQLSYAPIKKPVTTESDINTLLSLASLDDNYNMELMNVTIWNKFEENKAKYQKHLSILHGKINRFILIRSYMILLGNEKSPRWLQRIVKTTLKNFIIEENGVIITIKCIIEASNQSSNQSAHCLPVVKLISFLFLELQEDEQKCIIEQIINILCLHGKNIYERTFVQVAISIIEYIHRTNEKCEKFFLQEIFDPVITHTTLDIKLESAIKQLFNLYTLPTTIPITTIEPIILILFSIHMQIKDSVTHLKTPIRMILEKIISEEDELVFSKFMNILIFNELHPNEDEFSGREVVLTADGGIKFTHQEVGWSSFESGMLILEMANSIDNQGRIISTFFVYLLKKYEQINCTNTESDSKLVVVVLLLNALCENEQTIKYVLMNSETIIQFVKNLIRLHCEKCDEKIDVIKLCLQFLILVLRDLRYKKDVKWSALTPFLPYMKTLKKSKDVDVVSLSNEVHNLIMTRNLISDRSKVLVEEISKSACEKAIEEACDPLLPTRGHGLSQLISLIKKGNPETMAKKDLIQCLFQENMKDEDSFLYLRAIEGLSCLASMHPDDILPVLCDEFLRCKTFNTRLKIGEILLRTGKTMNEFLKKHKDLLTNTFLNGVKDKDPLIRTSSLANLGELCVLLQHGIQNILYEVVVCAEAVIETDNDVEPRRAAALLIKSLFQGFGNLMFEERRFLDLYKSLKIICEQDRDEKVRIQAGLALEAFNENIKAQLRELKLEKVISI